MNNERCNTLPAKMLSAPCLKCGVYPSGDDMTHITGTPEAVAFYCADCCPVCAEVRP